MIEAVAHRLADQWIGAWNRHDLEEIVSHYAEDVAFTFPLLDQRGGAGRGKAALRDYFAKSLAACPDLRFELRQVWTGMNTLTISYRGMNDWSVAEVMTLNPGNQITQVQAHYAKEDPASYPSVGTSTQEWYNGDYFLTDDPRRLELESVCALLRHTYWANDRPRIVIEKGVRNSVCLSLFCKGSQVGLSRAVTDHATFTWVCDVVVHPDHRGKGLGKWMVQCLLAHPELQTLSHHLCTKDAHTLYERFGFKRIEALRRGGNPCGL